MDDTENPSEDSAENETMEWDCSMQQPQHMWRLLLPLRPRGPYTKERVVRLTPQPGKTWSLLKAHLVLLAEQRIEYYYNSGRTIAPAGSWTKIMLARKKASTQLRQTEMSKQCASSPTQLSR